MSQISSQQLAAHLKRQVGRLYTLYGEEPLQLLESADTIRLAAREQGFTERIALTVSGVNFDWSEVSASISARSLFGEQQIVEIRIPSGKPGRDGSAALQLLAQDIASSQETLVLITLPQRLDRATQNSAWFKALNQHGVVVACNPVEWQALPQWITQRLAHSGLHLESGEQGKQTLAFFANHVEGNLLAAHQEIEKLSLLYPGTPDQPHVLSFEQVQSAVMDVARYDLFSLTQTILSGQVERSMRMLDGLLSEGQPHVRIHWVLADEVTTLLRVRESLDRNEPLPVALRENRIWGVRERIYERIMPVMTLSSCRALVRSAHICDGIMKGLAFPGWPDTPTSALRRLLLSMADATHASSKREKSFSMGKPVLALQG